MRVAAGGRSGLTRSPKACRFFLGTVV